MRVNGGSESEGEVDRKLGVATGVSTGSPRPPFDKLRALSRIERQHGYLAAELNHSRSLTLTRNLSRFGGLSFENEKE